jgi:hypothetical protein
MLDKKRSHIKLIAAIVLSGFIFIFAGWLLFNQQYVKDQVSVWAYTPTPGITEIEERVGFTDTGSFYFRVTQPEVADADTFNENCPRQEVGSPILGCYASGRIYIYNIENDELDGIEEVTAAHEMLHSAWERMSPAEQKRLGALLRSEYAGLVDLELKERMDYYARTEPGQLENELHSILGTEFEGLTSELETYYKKYFDDRQKVLGLHNKYDTVFKNLKAQSDALYDELVTLGKSVETRSIQYTADVAQLSADIESFNSRADSGNFSSIAQFNQERNALMARSNQLEADRISINNEIALYNEKYNQYQELSVKIESLNQSIDSIGDLEPAPSL